MARSMAEDVTRNKQGKEVDRDAASTRDCASSLGSNSIVDGEQKSAMGILWTGEEGKLAMETSTAVGSRGGKVTMEMLLEAGKMDMETVRGDRIDEDDDEENGDDKDKDMDMAAMSSDDKKSDCHLFYNPIVVLCGSSDCAVCLCEFEDGEMVRVLPRCGHGFHLECIYMWLHSHPNCPVCRTHVLLPDPEPSSPEASDAALLPPLPPLQHQDPVHDLQPFHVPGKISSLPSFPLLQIFSFVPLSFACMPSILNFCYSILSKLFLYTALRLHAGYSIMYCCSIVSKVKV